MSGVKRLVLADNGGTSVPTNDDLREEGVGSASKEDSSE